MTKIGIMTILLCFLLTAIASAGDSYLCVGNLATGFKYNKTRDKWEITKFNVDDSKYVVSRSKSEKFAWEIKKIGISKPISLCREDFNEHGHLRCQGLIDFIMNRENLRFIMADMIGYFFGTLKDEKGKIIIKEGDGSPNIEIGKCSPLP